MKEFQSCAFLPSPHPPKKNLYTCNSWYWWGREMNKWRYKNMKEVKWWNFDKCSQQIGQQISNPQRDQNKEESVNMDSGALGTLNQKVEHKANKNSLRFNGSVCTIGENKRTHQMNPYIWKKCLMVRWRIVQGEADMRPKEKKLHISSCEEVVPTENTTHNYSKPNKQSKHKEKKNWK